MLKKKFEDYAKDKGLDSFEAYFILFFIVTIIFCSILQFFKTLPLGFSFALWGFSIGYFSSAALGYFSRDYDIAIPGALGSLIASLVFWGLF